MKQSHKSLIHIIKRLSRAYPKISLPARDRNPYRILVVTILSAQCTDKIAYAAAEQLFKKYKGINSLSLAKPTDLKRIVYPTGFYNHKAKNIISASKRIIKEYNGIVPDTMTELLKLPGVGRKTANIVLSHGFQKSEGIAVDTHVRRLSRRLGLSNQINPDKIERDLLKIVPKRYWLDFNHIIVSHGRKVCNARNPLCCSCIINMLCPSNRCRL